MSFEPVPTALALSPLSCIEGAYDASAIVQFAQRASAIVQLAQRASAFVQLAYGSSAGAGQLKPLSWPALKI